MSKKIVTFGEIMLRLCPPRYERIMYARNFNVTYAGGEANVAVSLANYDMSAYFVSKIPNNFLGDAVLRELNAVGVHTHFIKRGGERLGTYFVEKGASVRSSKVVYDRMHSAIADANEDDFDFKSILEGKDWLHISGITPALSTNCANLTEQALKIAKDLGLMVSFDLNYRKKLWTPEQAQRVCIPLMKYVDVCIGNEEDAEQVLGFKPQGVDVSTGTLNIDAYKIIFEKMKKEFGFKYIATTLRESKSASDNGWSALLYDGKEFYQSKKYDLHIVDRVGGGDSFSGGIIYGLLAKKSLQAAIEFAVAASALKHTIDGDFNQVNIGEVEALVNGDGSGRVER